MTAESERPEEGTRRASLRRISRQLLNMQTAQFMALVIAGFYAVFELRLSRVDRHVDTAMSLVQNFSEGQLGENRRLLNDRWYSHWEEVQLLQEAGYGASSLPIQDFIRRTIIGGLDAEGQKEVRLAIAEITDSLDRLAICTQTPFNWRIFSMFAQCDPDTTNESICEYASSFHELYAPVIRETRETLGNGGLGVALEVYVTEGTCAKWLQD